MHSFRNPPGIPELSLIPKVDVTYYGYGYVFLHVLLVRRIGSEDRRRPARPIHAFFFIMDTL